MGWLVASTLVSWLIAVKPGFTTNPRRQSLQGIKTLIYSVYSTLR
jgi:hypothetical protein